MYMYMYMDMDMELRCSGYSRPNLVNLVKTDVMMASEDSASRIKLDLKQQHSNKSV